MTHGLRDKLLNHTIAKPPASQQPYSKQRAASFQKATSCDRTALSIESPVKKKHLARSQRARCRRYTCTDLRRTAATVNRMKPTSKTNGAKLPVAGSCWFCVAWFVVDESV